jgi:hypothetical protein
MDQQLELLEKLYNFYRSRYTGKELETKFNDACDDLIDTGDIKRAVYMKFCIENDMEPKLKKKSSSSSLEDFYHSSSSSSDPCSGGGYSRSHC